MKKLIIALTLITSITSLSSCRNRPGGPAQRVGHGIDRATYKMGSGIKRVGQSIQNAATR